MIYSRRKQTSAMCRISSNPLSLHPRRRSWTLWAPSLCLGLLTSMPANRTYPEQDTHSARSAPAISARIVNLHDKTDFTAFIRAALQRIERQWLQETPTSVTINDKRKVAVQLRIRKDGTLVGHSIAVDSPSGRSELDKAAVAAVRDAAPFERLPRSFGGTSIELRVTFDDDKSNLPPSVLH